MLDQKIYNDRKIKVLEAVVHDYILSGEPIGSRQLAKRNSFHLSPASLRNIMSDLEDEGLLQSPHPSAGRIPSDAGYRYYINQLIQLENLTQEEKQFIQDRVHEISPNENEILEITSHILSSISKQLGVILATNFYQGIFEKMTLLPVGTNKVLMALKIKSGLVRTVVVEIKTTLSEEQCQNVAQIINERMAGRTLEKIKNSLDIVFGDIISVDSPGFDLIRLFVDKAFSMIEADETKRLHIDGTRHIISQSQFFSQREILTIIEFLEEKEALVHLLESRDKQGGVFITIGGENKEGEFKSCTILTSPYNVGDVSGTLGIIGPTRMSYHRVIPLLSYTSEVLNEVFGHKV